MNHKHYEQEVLTAKLGTDPPPMTL